MEQEEQEKGMFNRILEVLGWKKQEINTNINWVVNYLPPPYTKGRGIVNQSGQLLNRSDMDYVARWLPEEQWQKGAAKGFLTPLNWIETGSFDLERGKPYFISATADVNVTWVGSMPEPVVFELSKEGRGYNYISLPFNTIIRKASQLCNQTYSGLPIRQDGRIGWWDVQEQRTKLSERCDVIIRFLPACEIDPNHPRCFDFDLEPGRVYRIVSTAEMNWTQR